MKTPLSRIGTILVVPVLGLVFLFLLLTALIFSQGKTAIPFFEKEPNDTVAQANPFPSSDATVALYGNLGSKNDIDFFSLPPSKDHSLKRLVLYIPENNLSSIRRPIFAIVGKGLGSVPTAFPLSLSSEEGVLTSTASKTDIPWHNSSTISSWKEIGTLSFNLPADISYQLVVYDPVGETGNYLLVEEGAEPHTLSQILKLIHGSLKAFFTNRS